MNKPVTATVFDIKEMGLYDGPGLRLTVFFKGCPLRCVWCHNPEGIFPQPQLIKMGNRCRHCGLCERPCIHLECIPFGVCTRICPDNLLSISGESYTTGKLLSVIRSYEEFYGENGGVTFSGGEPLLQAELLTELLSEIEGIHTAVETCGFVQPEVFDAIAPLFDLVYIDLKHMDEKTHKKLTGQDNRLVLRNIERLKSGNRPFIVRIPLIPGLTDTDENLARSAELLKGAPSLLRVELLPYNRLTGAKYKLLGMNYAPPFDERQEANRNTRLFSNRGIRCESLIF